MEGKMDEDELAHLVFPFGNLRHKKSSCVIISWKRCNKQILICPSGVPTGNGSLQIPVFRILAYSQFYLLFSLLQKLYLNTEVK